MAVTQRVCVIFTPYTARLADLLGSRYKHFVYRARVAQDTTRAGITSLRGTPIIVIVSHIEAVTMLPVNCTSFSRNELNCSYGSFSLKGLLSCARRAVAQ